MLVDEAADLLGIDPIELRLRNIATLGTKNVPPDVPALRNEEILRKAQGHPLWAGRKERKAKFEANNPGKRYGAALRMFSAASYGGRSGRRFGND